MADVKTEGLKAVDNSTITVNVSNNDKMTVEKQAGHPSASKNKTTSVKESSHEAPSVTPAQLKVASGNSAPTSPQKSDSKNSPTPSGVQPPKTPVQQQVKSKVNPWHKNSSSVTGTSGGVAKKGSGLTPEGGDKGGSSSGSSPPTEDSNWSRSIKIPKDEVCCIALL